MTVTVDALGNVMSEAGAVPASAGSDIRLTLDLAIQQACESGLNHAIESAKHQGMVNAGAGACICLDCTTGEVLGMASAPTFDPSVFIGGISNDDWEALNGEDSGNPMLNRAISGQYMSASTIKSLTSLAALEYGIYSSTRTTVCTGWWTGNGEENGQACWLETGHGTQNLQGGIAHSCDPVFYDIGHDFYYNPDNPEGMQETYRRYGLGSSTGIDLPGEEIGRVPDAAWKWEYFKSLGYSDEDSSWKGGDNCNIAIGQGDILVTCLQMADAYCSIANRGPAWKPHVLRGVRSKVGDGFVSEYRPEKIVDVEESQQDREIVERGMWGVIYEEAPTQTEHWTNMSVSVAGKTGTAEQTASHSNACWFGCYAPSDDPKYVVFANVDGGDWGSTTAMLVARDTLGAIYGEPDTVTSVVATGD